MISDSFDWKTGRVVFWDLDPVDESRPPADQTEHLKEDLAQIEYPAGVILDVGWYPEFSRGNGSILCFSRALSPSKICGRESSKAYESPPRETETQSEHGTRR